MKRTKNGLDLRKTPLIVIRPLGRENNYGQATHPDFALDTALPAGIEIDKATKGLTRLKYVLHEAAHVACPGATEETIVRLSAYQAKVLGALGYHGDDDEMDEQFAGPSLENLPRNDL